MDRKQMVVQRVRDFFGDRVEDVIHMVWQDRNGLRGWQEPAHVRSVVRRTIREDQNERLRSIRFAAPHILSVTFFPRWLLAIQAKLGSTRLSVTSDNLPGCASLCPDPGATEDAMRVRELMTGSLVTVRPDATVLDARQKAAVLAWARARRAALGD